MSRYKSFEFALRQKFGEMSLVDCVWAISALLIVIFLLGLFWGKLWNKKWGLGRVGRIILLGIIALSVALATLGWRGANRAISWLELKRDQITDQLTNSGTLNREIFKEAWTQLELNGGQKGLTAPPEGGQELRLTDVKETRTLAAIAAKIVRKDLISQRPFVIGAPFVTKDPDKVAEEVVETVTSPPYPVIVTPSNAWVKAAITAQVSAAIDSAATQVRTPMSELKTALTVFIIIIILIQLIAVPVAACKDIKVNPKV